MINELIPLLALVYGVCLGSFLNVVSLRYVDRLGTQPTLPATITGRSRCVHCHQVLRWWELLPLLSFIMLRGRCQRCHRALSWQYPLVEGLMGVLAWRIAYLYPDDIFTILLIVAITALLVVLAVIDFRTFLLPDSFIAGLGIVVLAWVTYRAPSWTSVLGGIGIGAGFLLLLWMLTRGEGIGLGDVKLMLPLGALVGSQGTIVLLFIAFCVGGLYGLFLLARRAATLKTAVPFGPFLIGAALLLIVWPTLPERFFALLFP